MGDEVDLGAVQYFLDAFEAEQRTRAEVRRSKAIVKLREEGKLPPSSPEPDPDPVYQTVRENIRVRTRAERLAQLTNILKEKE